jgi:hypothetical protein
MNLSPSQKGGDFLCILKYEKADPYPIGPFIML